MLCTRLVPAVNNKRIPDKNRIVSECLAIYDRHIFEAKKHRLDKFAGHNANLPEDFTMEENGTRGRQWDHDDITESPAPFSLPTERLVPIRYIALRRRGRSLFALASVFLVMLLLCGGGLYWAYRAGTAIQSEFFTAVGSGDPEQALSLMHPGLRDAIDSPIFAAWMKEVQSKLGGYQGISASEFSTSTRIENGQRVTECKGKVLFERGTAKSELVYHDGQLTRFLIESPEIPDRWFQGPEDTSIYQERGRQFLTAFCNKEADVAFGLMHKALQQAMPIEKLTELTAKVSDALGPLQSIDFKKDAFTMGDGEALVVYFEIVGEDSSTTASTKFEFVGMKGYLTAFNMAADIP